MLIYFFDVFLEPLFEHFVGFVQTKNLNFVHFDNTTVEQIDQAPWGGNYDVDPIIDFLDLIVDIGLAVNRHQPKVTLVL